MVLSAERGDTANLPMWFLEEHSEELRDILVPHLGAHDLASLACTCRLFSSWSSGARRPTLGLVREEEDAGSTALAAEAWKPKGFLGKDATMAKRRMIKVRMRMCTTHPNSDGLLVEHEVPPGKAVMPARTKLRVQLVRYGTGLVEEELYHSLYWKNGDWGKPGEPPVDPQAVKFMILNTLSSKRRPPVQFRLRFTLEVVRHGTEKRADYVHETPEFWVVDPLAIPKPGSARDRARQERPSARSLHV